MMNKHAYLIMAHNNWRNLETLIKLIDDDRNDIYIHIDRKTVEIDFQKIISIPKKSKIHVFSELKVYWGDYSQIKCELFLLEKSIKHNYSYYHLLSGSDLPIKSQNYIHDFFNKNFGCEFIHYQTDTFVQEKNIARRITLYHFLQSYRKRYKITFLNNLFTLIDKSLLGIQVILNIKRYKNTSEIKFGSQWFSITHDLARYLVDNTSIIKKSFSKSSCADELFIQTMVYNSKFRYKVSATQQGA